MRVFSVAHEDEATWTTWGNYQNGHKTNRAHVEGSDGWTITYDPPIVTAVTQAMTLVAIHRPKANGIKVPEVANDR